MCFDLAALDINNRFASLWIYPKFLSNRNSCQFQFCSSNLPDVSTEVTYLLRNSLKFFSLIKYATRVRARAWPQSTKLANLAVLQKLQRGPNILMLRVDFCGTGLNIQFYVTLEINNSSGRLVRSVFPILSAITLHFGRKKNYPICKYVIYNDNLENEMRSSKRSQIFETACFQSQDLIRFLRYQFIVQKSTCCLWKLSTVPSSLFGCSVFVALLLIQASLVSVGCQYNYLVFVVVLRRSNVCNILLELTLGDSKLVPFKILQDYLVRKWILRARSRKIRQGLCFSCKFIVR